jgi:hypothetical protein
MLSIFRSQTELQSSACCFCCRPNPIIFSVLICLGFLIFSFQTLRAQPRIWCDDNWSNGAYNSANGIDPEICDGALVLRNQPERMIYLGEPTAYRGIYGMVAYHDTLFICAGPYPTTEDGAEVLCYDYISNTCSRSYEPFEQGILFPKVFDDTLYIAGIDSRQLHSEGSAIYLYDGANWTCKQTLPRSTHAFDLVKHDGSIYVTTSDVSAIGGVWRSDDNGDHFSRFHAFYPQGNFRWMYAITAFDDGLYVQPDGYPPEENVIVVFHESEPFSLPAPGLPINQHGQFTAWGDSLIFTVSNRMYIYHEQCCFESYLPYIKDRWGRGLQRYGNSLYGGGLHGELHRWTPETGWQPDPTCIVLDYDTEIIESACLYYGRLFIGTSRIEGFSGGRLYMSLADSSGSLDSNIHDFGEPVWSGSIHWQAKTETGDQQVRFHVRSAVTIEEISECRFTGPDGTCTSYYETPGEDIHPDHWGHRYYQYRIFLTCPDGIDMPIIDSITLHMWPDNIATADEPDLIRNQQNEPRLILGSMNPVFASAGVELGISWPQSSHNTVVQRDVQLLICDLQGRILWQQNPTGRRDGETRCRWNCRTETGSPIGGGIYYAVLRASDRRHILDSRPLMILP